MTKHFTQLLFSEKFSGKQSFVLPPCLVFFISMGSDASWKVGGPREILTIKTKYYLERSIVLQNRRGHPPWPPSSEALLLFVLSVVEQSLILVKNV